MSTGAVKLIDWKSIENANMATVEFKNELIKTAVELGTIVEKEGMYVSTTTDLQGKVSDAFTATTRFNDSLSSQWMTTDVLVETLKRYTDETTELGKKAFAAAQDVKTFSQLMDTLKEAVGSGWAYTFEIIFGDFNEAKELWTDVNNVVGEFIDTMSNARNDLLRGGLSTGWKNFTRQYVSDAETLKSEIEDVARNQIENFDKMVDKAGGFENSLENGWLTADILATSIGNLETKLSGLSAEQLREIGYSQEQQREFTALWAKVQNGTLSLQELEEQLARTSGRKNLIEGLANVFKALMSIIKPIKIAFEELFPPLTVASLYEMTVRFRELTEHMILSTEAMYTLKVIAKAILLPFRLLFSVLELGAYIFFDLAASAFDMIDALISIPAKTKSVKSALLNSFAGEELARIGSSIITIIGNIISALSSLASAAMNMFSKLLQNEKAQKIFTTLGNIFKTIAKEGLSLIADGLERLAEFDFTTIPTAIADAFTTAWEAVKNFFGLFGFETEKIDTDKGIAETTKEISAMKGVMTTIAPILSSFSTDMVDLSGAVAVVSEMFGKFVTSFTGFLENLTAGKILVYAFGTAVTGLAYSTISALDTVANGVAGLFTQAKLILTNVATAVTKLSTSGANLMDALTKRIKPSVASQFKTIVLTISVSVFILAAAIGILTNIPYDTLQERIKILGEIVLIFVGSLTALVAVFGIFSIVSPTFAVAVKSFGASVLLFSIAITIMVKALMSLSTVSIEYITQQLISFSEFLVITLGIMAVIGGAGTKASLIGATQMLLFSFAIGNMVKAFEGISNADFSGMKRNIGELIMIIGLLSIFSIAAGRVRFGTAIGVLGMVLGIQLLLDALEDLATRNYTAIMNGVGRLIPLMAAIMGLLAMTRAAGDNAMKAGVSMMFMAGAILIIAQAVDQLGKLDKNTIVKGTAAVDAILAAFALITAWSGNVGLYAANAGKSILFMSVAILALQFAVKYLGQLDTKVVVQGTGAVVAILGMFALVMLASRTAESSVGVILALAFNIGILTTALMMLTLVQPIDDVLTAAEGISLVMTAFAVSMKVIDKINFKGAAKSLATLLAITAIVGVIVLAIGAMNIDVQKALPVVEAMVILFGALTVMSRLIKGGSWSDLSGIVFAFVSTMGAIAIVLSAMSDLNVNPDTVIINATAISEVMLALALCTRIMNGQVTGPDVVTASNTMKVMATFVGLAGAALIALNYLGGDPKLLIGKATALSEVLLVMALCTRIMNGQIAGSAVKSANITMKLIGEFVILATAALIALNLTSSDPKLLFARATALSEILVVLAFCTSIMNGKVAGSAVKSANNTMKLMAEFVTLATLALIALNFSGQDPTMVLANATALSEILLALGLCTRIMNGQAGGVDAAAAVMTMIEMGVFITEAAAMLGLLNHFGGADPVVTLANATALSEILIAIGVCTRVMNGDAAGTNWAAIAATIVEVGVFLAGAVIALRFLNDLDDPVQTLANATALSAILLAISKAMAILAVPGFISGVGGMLAGAAGVALVIGALGGLVLAFGTLTKTDGLEELLNRGVMVFQKIGQAIGELIGGVLSGILSGFVAGANPIAQLGSILSEFAIKLLPFITTMKLVDGSVLTSVGTLVKAILALTAADFITGIKNIFSFFMGGYDKSFGDTLSEFTDPLIKFAQDISYANIDAKAVRSVATLGNMIANLEEAIPREGGFIQSIIGNKTGLDTFGDSLEAFGKGVRRFAVGIRGLTDEDYANLERAKDMGISLSELNNHLPATGGNLQTWLGKPDLARFGAQLTIFGNAMVKFGTKIRGITDTDYENMGKVAQYGQALADLNNSLPSTGGRLQEFLGQPNLVGFGKNLKTFGRYMCEFGNLIKLNQANLDEDMINKAVIIGQTLASLDEVIPEGDSVKSFFFGKADWTSFGENIKSLGEAIVSFCNNIGSLGTGVDPTTTLEKLGGDLVTYLSNGIEAKFPVMEKAGKDTADSFDKGIKDYIESMRTAIKEFCDAVKEAFKTNLGITNSTSTVFSSMGQNVVNGLINGVKAKTESLKSTMVALANDAKTSFNSALDIQSPSRVFETIGGYIVEGLAKGVEETTPIGAQAMVKMGEALLEAEQDYWEINSPSIVAKDEIGHFIVKGIAEGITEDMSAEEAAAKKADNILKAFQDAVAKNDNAQSIEDSKHKLWELMNPKPDENASEDEKKAYENSKMEETLRHLQETAKNDAHDLHLLEDAVKSLKENGSSAEDIEKAEADVWKQKVKLMQDAADIQEQEKSFYDTEYQKIKANNEKYNDYIKMTYDPENMERIDALIAGGFSREEALKTLQQKAGWDPTLPKEYAGAALKSVEELYNSFLETNENIYEYPIEDITKKAVTEGMTKGAKKANTKKSAKAAVSNFSNELNKNTSKNSSISKNTKKNIEDIFSGIDPTSIAARGDQLIDTLGSGIQQGLETGKGMYQTVKSGFKSRFLNSSYEDFHDAGVNSAVGYSDGLIESIPQASAAMQAFYQTGMQASAVSGDQVATSFMDGFYEAAQNGQAAMTESLGGTRQVLDEQQPLYYESGMSIGDQLTNGLLTAIQNGIPAITQAAANAAREAYQSAMASLGGGGGRSSSASLNGAAQVAAFNLNQSKSTLSASTSSKLASRVSSAQAQVQASKQKAYANQSQNESTGTSSTTYTFNQYNSSPKALSRTEIYRDTRNLFAKSASTGREYIIKKG